MEQELVEKVGAALREECLKEFGSTWSFDVAWKFAKTAIDVVQQERLRREEEWLKEALARCAPCSSEAQST